MWANGLKTKYFYPHCILDLTHVISYCQLAPSQKNLKSHDA